MTLRRLQLIELTTGNPVGFFRQQFSQARVRVFMGTGMGLAWVYGYDGIPQVDTFRRSVGGVMTDGQEFCIEVK